MRKVYILILALIISFNSFSQEEIIYKGSKTIVSDDSKLMVITDNYGYSGENFINPKYSTIYTFPLNCEKGKELIPADYKWIKDKLVGNIFSDLNKIVIYTKDGNYISEVKNGISLSYHDTKNLFFFRHRIDEANKYYSQIWKYSFEKDSVELFYEFDSLYSMINPDSEDFLCPKNVDLYWGGIRGVVYRADEYPTCIYTFIIDYQKRLLFFKKGEYLKSHEKLPQDGFVKY